MEASTKDLRLHTKELLSATRRGEEVVITFRGKRTARLVPVDEVGDKPGKNPGFGMWADETENVDQQVRRLRQGRDFS